MPTWDCGNCGTSNDISLKNCHLCGFSQEDTKKLEEGTHWYCKSCKVVVKKGKDCPKCGNKDPSAEDDKPVTWDCKWCGKTGISEKDHPKKCPDCRHKRGTSPPPPKTWDCKWCGKTGISEKEHPEYCPNPDCGHKRGTRPGTWTCSNPECRAKISEKDYPDKCPVCGADRYPKTDPDPVTWDCKWCDLKGISEKEHPKYCPECRHKRGTSPKTWECPKCHSEISEKDYPDECPNCGHKRYPGSGPGRGEDGDALWRCKYCGYDNNEKESPYECSHCHKKRWGPDPHKFDFPLKKILAVIALIAIVYLVGLHMVTNPDVPLIQFGDGSGSVEQTPTVSPTEAVILGAFTVTDGQNPSKSASLPDGQKGVVYNNTLSFPYGSPYYVLGITDVVPPVTITASNLVPTNTQASLELSLKDSEGNTVDTIQLGSSDTKRSKKITIREAGNYILIMDGKYVESVVITIEKT